MKRSARSHGPQAVTRTFLFTDIEGSTRRWEESPEMHELVERHFAVLRAAVEGLGGEVFATMGDGIAAAFTSADAAVQAAIASQLLMPTIGLEVRMGVHTGEVERGRGRLPRPPGEPGRSHLGGGTAGRSWCRTCPPPSCDRVPAPCR